MNDNLLTGFERLASQAKREPPLPMNVADRVLGTLQSRRVQRSVERDVVLCGAASVVAAGLAMAVVWIGSADDTLLPLVQPFVTVLP